MKLINQNVEEWHCGYTLPEIWSHIAKCARTCYQSEPRNNGETDEEFVKRVILRNHSLKEIAENRDLQLKLHLSVLENGTVYLELPKVNYVAEFYKVEPHSKTYTVYIGSNKPYVYVTTNMRVIVEHGRINDLEYICTPTKYHYLRTTFNITTDIGVARELARHRAHSISEESTRYCNYTNKKLGGELQFIRPAWLDIPLGKYILVNGNLIYTDEFGIHKEDIPVNNDIYTYLSISNTLDATYRKLIENGWTPQQARQILPLSTKVQTIHTAFESDWAEFISLRAEGCSGAVHPNMKVIADKIKCLMAKENA